MPEMKELKVEYISLVKYPANRKGLILKGDQTIIPIAKMDDDKQLVYGLVYTPNEVDTDGDFATAEVIEKASYDFMKSSLTNNIDRNHDFNPTQGYVAESWITKEGDPMFPDEPVGSWAVAIKVESEETWAMLKSGELGGISLAGVANLAESNKSEKGLLKKMKDFLDEYFGMLVMPVAGEATEQETTKQETAKMSDEVKSLDTEATPVGLTAEDVEAIVKSAVDSAVQGAIDKLEALEQRMGAIEETPLVKMAREELTSEEDEPETDFAWL